jgi:hypothetical protein
MKIHKYILNLIKMDKFKCNHKRDNVVVFNNICWIAKEIASKNPLGLPDLVKSILRPIQYQNMYSVVEKNEYQAVPAISQHNFFMPDQLERLSLFCGDLFSAEGEAINLDRFRLRLGRDLVLPPPWNKKSFVSALAGIGSSKIPYQDDCEKKAAARWVSAGAWRADSNHVISLWLPWGIGFVFGGNHSITAGILAGEGEICPTEIINFGRVLDHVRCDGKGYFRVADDQKIADVEDARHAAIFEIGRLMRDHGVSAFS